MNVKSFWKLRIIENFLKNKTLVKRTFLKALKSEKLLCFSFFSNQPKALWIKKIPKLKEQKKLWSLKAFTRHTFQEKLFIESLFSSLNFYLFHAFPSRSKAFHPNNPSRAISEVCRAQNSLLFKNWKTLYTKIYGWNILFKIVLSLQKFKAHMSVQRWLVYMCTSSRMSALW